MGVDNLVRLTWELADIEARIARGRSLSMQWDYAAETAKREALKAEINRLREVLDNAMQQRQPSP